MRHNEIRDFIANQLSKVCRDVQKEPTLQPLVGTETLPKSTNTSREARLDVSARGFWVTGQKAFFDVRVFNPLAKRYATQDPTRSYVVNENDRKREYNERVLQTEHGSFTPLVFAATGGTGRECLKFIKRLSDMISNKERSRYSETVSWFFRKLNFMLIRAIHTCFRGSRTTQNFSSAIYDVGVTEALTNIRQ